MRDMAPDLTAVVNDANINGAPFINSTGETIPAYAAMRVLGRDQTGVFVVGLPSYDGQNNLIFNGPTAVPSPGYGEGNLRCPAPITFTPDPIDGSFPILGETWGVIAGDWTLNKGYPGFECIDAGQTVNGTYVAGFREATPAPAANLFYARMYTATLPAYTRTRNTVIYNAVGAAAAIDRVTPAVGDVILFNPLAIDGGLWVFTAIGDASNNARLERVAGLTYNIRSEAQANIGPEGAGFGNTTWKLVTPNPIITNVTPQTWTLAVRSSVTINNSNNTVVIVDSSGQSITISGIGGIIGSPGTSSTRVVSSLSCVNGALRVFLKDVVLIGGVLTESAEYYSYDAGCCSCSSSSTSSSGTAAWYCLADTGACQFITTSQAAALTANGALVVGPFTDQVSCTTFCNPPQKQWYCLETSGDADCGVDSVPCETACRQLTADGLTAAVAGGAILISGPYNDANSCNINCEEGWYCLYNPVTGTDDCHSLTGAQYADYLAGGYVLVNGPFDTQAFCLNNCSGASMGSVNSSSASSVSLPANWYCVNGQCVKINAAQATALSVNGSAVSGSYATIGDCNANCPAAGNDPTYGLYCIVSNDGLDRRCAGPDTLADIQQECIALGFSIVGGPYTIATGGSADNGYGCFHACGLVGF